MNICELQIHIYSQASFVGLFVFTSSLLWCLLIGSIVLMWAFFRLVLTTYLNFPATTAKEPQHVRNIILFCFDGFESSTTQEIFCPSCHYSFLYIRQKSLHVCKRALTVCKRTPPCPQQGATRRDIFSPSSHISLLYTRKRALYFCKRAPYIRKLSSLFSMSLSISI